MKKVICAIDCEGTTHGGMDMNQEEIVKKINEKIMDLNSLFEQASAFDIKFECRFDQSKSFGSGKLAHLILEAYQKM